MKTGLIVMALCLAAAPASGERVERGNLVTENIPETPQVFGIDMSADQTSAALTGNAE